MSRRVTQQLTIMAPEALKIVNYIAGSDSAIDFHKIIPVAEPHNNIICAALNREVDELNDLAQAQRLHAGAIDPSQQISIRRKISRLEPAVIETFCIGDRVNVTRKSQKYGVENGDTGTLIGISQTPLSKKMSVLFDGEESPRILCLRKVSVRRGYAFTTHKLQGATADNVYVAMTGPMLNLQMAYVQMSRHKHKLNLYVPEHLAEKDLLKTVQRRSKLDASKEPIAQQSELRSVLCNLMAKDAGKDLAHDVIKNQVPATSRNRITREEAERMLQSFAQQGELEFAKGSRKLHDTIALNWQSAGGVARPEQHKIFAQHEADRQKLNCLAQQQRKASGLLDPTRSFDAGKSRFLVGDHIRFESPLKQYRISAGATATLVDVNASSVKIKLHASNEVATVPNLVVYDAQQFSSQQLTALCDAVSHVGGRLILCGNWTAMDREHPDVAGAISDALGHGLPEVSVGNHLDKAWELGNELEPYTKTEKELLRHAESLPWVVVANCWWEQGANSVRSIHASKEEALNAIPEIFSEESNEHSFFFQGDWSETDSPSVSAAEWQLATLPEIGDRVRISNDAVVSLISLEERLPLPEYLRPDSRETDPLAKTRSFLVFHANSEEARTFPDDYTLVAKVEAQSMDHAVFLSQHTDAQWTANPGVTSFMTRPRSTQSGDVIIDHDVARRYVGGKEWRPALTASDRVVHELAPESFTADPEPELRELHTNDFRLKF